MLLFLVAGVIFYFIAEGVESFVKNRGYVDTKSSSYKVKMFILRMLLFITVVIVANLIQDGYKNYTTYHEVKTIPVKVLDDGGTLTGIELYAVESLFNYVEGVTHEEVALALTLDKNLDPKALEFSVLGSRTPYNINLEYKARYGVFPSDKYVYSMYKDNYKSMRYDKYIGPLAGTGLPLEEYYTGDINDYIETDLYMFSPPDNYLEAIQRSVDSDNYYENNIQTYQY